MDVDGAALALKGCPFKVGKCIEDFGGQFNRKTNCAANRQHLYIFG